MSHPIANVKTVRPPVWLEGLYSTQSVASDPAAPDIVRYWSSVEGAVAAKDEAAKTGRFASHLLRHSPARLDRYHGITGKIEGTEDSPVHGALDVSRHVPVDRRALLRRARELVLGARAAPEDTLAFAACYEGGGGAKVADRANYWVLLRDLVQQAPDDDFRSRVYLVEDGTLDVKVSMVAVRLWNAPGAFQDHYLDLHHKLQTGIPIDKAVFFNEMQRMLVVSKFELLKRTLSKAWRLHRPEDHEMRVDMAFDATSPERRREMARVFLAAAARAGAAWYAEHWASKTLERVVQDPTLQAELTSLMTGPPRSNS